ncbi:hypothetical protein [Celeribacter sp.]|uniref:hypothetical protein n=1 Tax=Celeribacter sp. TaxID=1890673 RepID=UPI003A8DA4A7
MATHQLNAEWLGPIDIGLDAEVSGPWVLQAQGGDVFVRMFDAPGGEEGGFLLKEGQNEKFGFAPGAQIWLRAAGTNKYAKAYLGRWQLPGV